MDLEAGLRVYFRDEAGRLHERWVAEKPLPNAKKVWLRKRPLGEEPSAVDKYMRSGLKEAVQWRDQAFNEQQARDWCAAVGTSGANLWPSRVKTILRWIREDNR